jgi:hypothetical protein
MMPEVASPKSTNADLESSGAGGKVRQARASKTKATQHDNEIRQTPVRLFLTVLVL